MLRALKETAMIYDSLFDAILFFFSAWGLVVGAVVVVAFGRDLLPVRVPVETAHRNPSASRDKR